MRYATRLGVALSLVLAAVGCSSPVDDAPSSGRSASEVDVTSCGRKLSFSEPPERAVTLEQSSTETLLALGLADRMAGTSYLNTEVAPQYREDYEKVPVLSPDVLTGEQLRNARPDVVVAAFGDHYFTRDRVGTREELAELGVPSYVSAVDCGEQDGSGKTPFELLFADYCKLGKIFGVEDRAAKLISGQRKRIARARETAADVKGEPTVVWLYSVYHGMPYVAGKGGIPSAASRLLGVKNAFDDIDEQWPEVSWEEIADRNPDVIVVGDLSERGAPGDSAEDKLAMMRKDPVVSELPALRHKRILEVPGVEMDPSVRSVHILPQLAQGLENLGYVR